MRLRTDDRAVTVQIGTVLLFAVLIILLSTYQATVVPQQNEQVEFNHNQQVQGDLQELRDEILRTAVTDAGGTASISLGARYPERALFVNPAPPSGTLRTTAPANVTVENATAVGETGDYWDGSAQNFSTRGLTYDPIYHAYQRPPTTVYENGVLYNRFDGANRILAGQRLVRGNRISLVTVNGSLSESGSARANVDVRAVSVGTRTVTVRNESSNVSVVVPTTLPAETWTELLAAEMSESDGDRRHVLAVEDGRGENAVRIVLEPGTYELQLAKVGVGGEVSDTGPHYVTDVRGDNASVPENSTRKLVVEVRDRYNNPVLGARVNISLVDNQIPDRLVHLGESGKSLKNLKTGSDGRVTVRYDLGNFQGQNQKVAVRASIASVPSNNPRSAFARGTTDNLTYSLTAVSVSGQGTNGGKYPPDIVAFTVNDASQECIEQGNGGCRGGTDNAEFDVNWEVTDDDGDFESVTVYVNKSGETVETYTKPSGTKTYTEDGAYGEDYTVKLVAYDGEGNRMCEVVTDTADGDDADQTRSSC